MQYFCDIFTMGYFMLTYVVTLFYKQTIFVTFLEYLSSLLPFITFFSVKTKQQKWFQIIENVKFNIFLGQLSNKKKIVYEKV